jgi:pimeloyl-ACP methyl ester carboxylesterase
MVRIVQPGLGAGPDGPVSTSAAVVLVHGLWMRPITMVPLARRLARAGFEPILFGYAPVRVPLDANAAQLTGTLLRAAPSTVHVVGHSLGGLLALAALGAPGLPAGRVVCLGSPLRGCRSAERLARHRWGRRIAGASLGLLRTGLARLPDDRQVAMIAGTLSLGLGRLLGGVEKPNDGVVSLAETRVPDLAAHAAVAVNHLGLLFSPRVASLVARFLAVGRF